MITVQSRVFRAWIAATAVLNATVSLLSLTVAGSVLKMAKDLGKDSQADGFFVGMLFAGIGGTNLLIGVVLAVSAIGLTFLYRRSKHGKRLGFFSRTFVVLSTLLALAALPYVPGMTVMLKSLLTARHI